MYSSSQDFTLTCAAGETGSSVTRSATATSIISQQDAYNKAYGMAKALAFEYLECSAAPGPTPTIYYNVQKSATVSADGGYIVDSWTVTILAGAVYSLVSQAAADTAAQTAATVQATQQKNIHQRRAFGNDVQVAFGSCSIDYLPYSTTITVSANTVFSAVSKAAANTTALANAQAALATALSSNCVRLYQSVAVTASAVCSSGLVGDPTIVNYPAGEVATTASQSAANSGAQSKALSVAIATIVCNSGFGNTTQVFAAVCQQLYGGCFSGTVVSKSVAANTYFDAVQSVANSKALSAAKTDAIAHVVCTYIC